MPRNMLSRRALFDIDISDTFFLNVLVELCLELLTSVVRNFMDTKRKLLDYIIAPSYRLFLIRRHKEEIKIEASFIRAPLENLNFAMRK